MAEFLDLRGLSFFLSQLRGTFLSSDGVARQAQRLSVARNINGTLFDGSSDITIPSVETAVTADNATHAVNADHADTATTADSAETAVTAGNATTADRALTADSATHADESDLATFATDAGTAEQLAVARRINGVLFDGTSDITITAESVQALNESEIDSIFDGQEE